MLLAILNLVLPEYYYSFAILSISKFLLNEILLLDNNFQLKIADAGFFKLFEKENDTLLKTDYVGTRGYQAPEILKKKEYTTACDVFSCGVVLFILLAGYPPFFDEDQRRLFRKIQDCKYHFHESYWKHIRNYKKI